MRCSDVERLLPEVIEGIGYPEFEAHLKLCPRCAELVSDLKWIASESRGLAECDEPPPRVWVNIANQLRSEGIIREPQTAPARVFVPARPRRRIAWWLAPVAAAIIAAGAYQLTHYSAPPVAQQAAQQPTAQPAPSVQQPAAQSASQVAQSSVRTAPATPTAKTQQVAKQPATGPVPAVNENPNEQAEISPPPSADDERFLSEVSQGAPSMRATYENQLRAVNAEIRETQEYIKWHPGDLDARQHLMEVYQQKAMLYQMALDRIQ